MDERDPLRELEAVARQHGVTPRHALPPGQPPAFPVRLGAIIIDLVAMTFFTLAILLVLIMCDLEPETPRSIGAHWIAAALFVLIYTGIEAIAGRAVGKVIFQLRITSVSPRSAGLLRWFIIASPAIVSLVLGIAAVAIAPHASKTVRPSTTPMIDLAAIILLAFVPWWLIMSLVTIGYDRQTIPDYVAGTTVLGRSGGLPAVRGFEPVMGPRDERSMQ